MSAKGVAQRDQIVFQTAFHAQIPIIMLLSGGYQQTNAKVIADSIINLNRVLDICQEPYRAIIDIKAETDTKSTTNNNNNKKESTYQTSEFIHTGSLVDLHKAHDVKWTSASGSTTRAEAVRENSSTRRGVHSHSTTSSDVHARTHSQSSYHTTSTRSTPHSQSGSNVQHIEAALAHPDSLINAHEHTPTRTHADSERSSPLTQQQQHQELPQQDTPHSQVQTDTPHSQVDTLSPTSSTYSLAALASASAAPYTSPFPPSRQVSTSLNSLNTPTSSCSPSSALLTSSPVAATSTPTPSNDSPHLSSSVPSPASAALHHTLDPTPSPTSSTSPHILRPLPQASSPSLIYKPVPPTPIAIIVSSSSSALLSTPSVRSIYESIPIHPGHAKLASLMSGPSPSTSTHEPSSTRVRHDSMDSTLHGSPQQQEASILIAGSPAGPSCTPSPRQPSPLTHNLPYAHFLAVPPPSDPASQRERSGSVGSGSSGQVLTPSPSIPSRDLLSTNALLVPAQPSLVPPPLALSSAVPLASLSGSSTFAPSSSISTTTPTTDSPVPPVCSSSPLQSVSSLSSASSSCTTSPPLAHTD